MLSNEFYLVNEFDEKIVSVEYCRGCGDKYYFYGIKGTQFEDMRVKLNAREIFEFMEENNLSIKEVWVLIVGDYIKFKCNGRSVLGEVVYITEDVDNEKVNISVKTDSDFYMAVSEDDVLRTILDKEQYQLIKNKLKNTDFYLYTSDEEKAFAINITDNLYYVYNLSGNRFWSNGKIVESMTKRKFKTFKTNKDLYEIGEIKQQSDIFDFL